jgi:hypothetical protein
MANMTEQEADRLDELYTKTAPKVDFDKPGVFARQKEMVVSLDSFAARYIMSKSLATKKSPTELISDMVRNDMTATAL